MKEFHKDKKKLFKVDPTETGDILKVTSSLPGLGVTALRRFRRVPNVKNDQERSRRHSVL